MLSHEGRTRQSTDIPESLVARNPGLNINHGLRFFCKKKAFPMLISNSFKQLGQNIRQNELTEFAKRMLQN